MGAAFVWQLRQSGGVPTATGYGEAAVPMAWQPVQPLNGAVPAAVLCTDPGKGKACPPVASMVPLICLVGSLKPVPVLLT